MADGKTTIAALATPRGRGGIAVVRVSGPEAFSISAALCGRAAEPGRVRLCTLQSPCGSSVIDRCVVIAFKGPFSYTGEDVVEFQCHGGSVTPRRVLEACFAAGAVTARRGEFTERAFLNGRISYEQAEGVLDLIDAKTDRAADDALRSLSGGRQREVRGLYDRALALSAELEHSLDVSEEELPEDFSSAFRESFAELSERIGSELRRLREGKILRDGATVVLAGAPNAGKSSLLNALLGESRAIVSDVPGTTRDSIEEWMDIGGWPVRLVDTAGIRDCADGIEREGIERTRKLISAADLVVTLLPSDELGAAAVAPPGGGDALIVRSKCDLCAGPRIEGALYVSAASGEGLDALKGAIARRLEAAAADGEDCRGSDEDVFSALSRARSVLLDGGFDDPVLVANRIRSAAEILGASVGAVYSADLLDSLFSKFCVGK